MIDAKIVDLPYLNDTFPSPLEDEIKRDIYVDTILKCFNSGNDIIFVEGDDGIGKTTILAQFAKQNPYNTISYFINASDRVTYNTTCLNTCLYKQIRYYIKEEIVNDIDKIDDNFLQIFHSKLISKINRDRKPLYFVFDGFSDISEQDLSSIKEVLLDLPWSRAKFIFSGNQEKLIHILPQKRDKLKFKPIILNAFSLDDTKKYFTDLPSSPEEINEIYKICEKGIPEKLSHVKRICKDIGVEKFLSEDITEKTDLFEFEWKKVSINEKQQEILALVAFENNKHSISRISKILSVEENEIITLLKPISFIEFINGEVVFISESYKKFAKNKFEVIREKTLETITNYFIENQSDEESLLNLPGLFQRAKNWQALVTFLSLDNFILLVGKYQTYSTMKRQFDYGINASKQMSNCVGDYFRFSLHKSAFKELEKFEIWESEIEARISLEQYEESLNLANTAFLKEDRLKLLAILAKVRVEKNLPVESFVVEQIHELYNQIDFETIREKAHAFSALLLYSCPEIAIEIAEKASGNSSGSNSVDWAFAYLSLFAMEINKKTNAQTADIDSICSKIKDIEIKNLTSAIKYLSDEYNADELIRKVETLNTTSKKLFLLRNWIKNNKEKQAVECVIEYTLNTIIGSSLEDVPNSVVLAEIASALPYLDDPITIKGLVSLFDTQKNTIIYPTKDFVKLQLTLAEAESKINFDSTRERIYEIYFFIDEIKDLSIKTDCLAIFWLRLLRIDIEGKIEAKDGFINSSVSEINKNLTRLFNTTAQHYQISESIIKSIVKEKPIWAKQIIQEINVEDRRDFAYRLAIIHYLKHNKIEKIDFEIVKDLYTSIKNFQVKDEALSVIIDRLSNEKEKIIPFIPKINEFINRIKEIADIDDKCNCYTSAILILDHDKVSTQTFIDSLIRDLKNNWDSIDIQWQKIEIGFKIASKLSLYSKELALDFLNESANIKEAQGLTSTSVAYTYLLSVRICIKAFAGVIASAENLSEDIELLAQRISLIRSSGEQVKLWNEVALKIYSASKFDYFKEIVKTYIKPLYSDVNIYDKNYKYHLFIELSPTFFNYHSDTYIEELKSLPIVIQDRSIRSVINFIFTKKYSGEPIDHSDNGYEITFEEAKDICKLINLISNDFIIYTFIEELVLSIRRHSLTSEIKNDLKKRILDIINLKFPYSAGIKHDGYKIISFAYLYSLDGYNPTIWADLIKQAKNIPNVSDKGLVLSILADIVSDKSKKLKIQLLNDSFEIFKDIPSNLDKFYRYDSILPLLAKTDKGQFQKRWNEIFKDIVDNKEGNLNNLRNIIDIAQKYDPKCAEKAVVLLDQDEARKKLKEPIQHRMDMLNRKKSANEDYKNISVLKVSEEIIGFSYDKLAKLNSGKTTCKNIDETVGLLEKISNLPLSDSYHTLCLFIQNAILKHKTKDKYNGILRTLFNATIENAKLIDIASLDSIVKMKNRLKYSNIQSHQLNPVLRPGNKKEASDYIGKWFDENLNDKLIIIDPYFTQEDLSILKIILEVKPACIVEILTSKESGNNDFENNEEEYNSSWKNIHDENPPETSISIVWIDSNDNKNKKSPFHDRWLISDVNNCGLKLGTSFNALGVNKDSQISSMSVEEVTNVQNSIINDYLNKRVKRFRDYKLRYSSFELGA